MDRRGVRPTCDPRSPAETAARGFRGDADTDPIDELAQAYLAASTERRLARDSSARSGNPITALSERAEAWRSASRRDIAVSLAELLASLPGVRGVRVAAVSYTHLRAHETPEHLVCRL